MKTHQTFITKDAASIAAKEILKKKYEFIDSLKKDAENYLYNIVEKKLPTIVLESYRKHPEFFRTSKSISLVSNRWDHHSTGKYLPSSGDQIKLTDNQQASYDKLGFKISAEEAKIQDLFNELSAAIYSARTVSKCIELIPESKPFLKENYPPPAIDIPKLRAKIK